MDEFIRRQLDNNIRIAVARAKQCFDRGDSAAGIAICHQIVDRDRSAVGPYFLFHREQMKAGNWAMALDLGMRAMHTRPEFEGERTFESETGVSYADFARSVLAACDGTERVDAERGERGAHSAQSVLARGVAAHTAGDLDAARAHYEKVLMFGSLARRVVGEAINLLHALEHQAGRPDAARKWLDIETFPLCFHLSDFYDGDWRAFCDALFGEVIGSPLLTPTTDPQSRGWLVGDNLNRDGCGPRVKELECCFADLASRNRAVFDALRHDFVHEVFKDFPEDHRIKIFCSLMRGAGHIGPHHHNDGYLVGNLYVRVPEEPDGEGTRNCIEFGKNLFHAATGGGYPTRTVMPETGTVLIWPAYYNHSVPPSRAASPRMVVGFDLVPARFVQ